jgi:hypothetical protein
MKLIPSTHVELFRDLLALAEKYNVKEFYDSDGGYCGLIVGNTCYLWGIDGSVVTILFDFPGTSIKDLAEETFADENVPEKAKLYGVVSYWVSIKITNDDIKEFAHQTTMVGGKQETKTKELK